MDALRTPEGRFEDLPDFPYRPFHVKVHGLRIHYVEEGDGDPVLCLHGEPTWAYLYRKMIPLLSRRARTIAMDFVGFGRSDKLADREAYTYRLHRDTLAAFIQTLNLERITLVVQDWGGLIGLRLAGEWPERFDRLVIMNTGLPTGEERVSNAFRQWRQFVESTPDLPIGQIIQWGTVRQVPDEVLAAYEVPFPDGASKAGASVWPLMVPIEPDDPVGPEMKKAREDLSKWDKPALVLFSDGDPITRGGDRFFRKLIPTASEQPELTIEGAGHFLQEDRGEEIARQILSFLQRAPLR